MFKNSFGNVSIAILVTLLVACTSPYEPVILSDNTNLGSLSLKSGETLRAVSPAFNASVQSYTATVPYSVTSITVEATAVEVGATLEGVGTQVLAVGANSFSVVVTSPSGKIKTYGLTVTRSPQSGDATLSSLIVQSGGTVISLNPPFDPAVTVYSAQVAQAVASVNISAIVNHEGASVAGVGAVDLSTGENPKTLTVTAEDASTKVYNLTISRLASGSTTVADPILTPPGGTSVLFNTVISLSSSTAGSMFRYTLGDGTQAAPTDTTGIMYNDTAKPAITVGNTVIKAIAYKDGMTASAVVTGTYQIVSSDTSLSTLTLTSGVTALTLNPVFDPAVTVYSAEVANSVTSVTLGAQTTDSGSSVTGVGDKTLIVGSNPFTLTVTAGNSATRTYSLTVTRLASGSSVVADPTLSPPGGSNVLVNTLVSLSSSTTGSTFRYTLGDGTQAAPTDTTGTVYNDAAKPAITVGNTVIKAIAYKDGMTASAVVTGTYQIVSSDTSLSTLTLTSGVTALTLNPVFDPGVTVYSAEVANSVTSVTLGAQTTDTGSSVTGAGLKNLNVGVNPFTLTVTAGNNATRDYSVTITRLGPDPVAVNSPSFTPPGGTVVALNTAISISTSTPGGLIRYTIGNGTQAAPTTTTGTLYSDLAKPTITVGNTVIKSIAYKDGMTSSVVVTTTYVLSSDANLQGLTVTQGATVLTLSPAFSANQTSYTVSVPHDVTSVTIAAQTAHLEASVSGTGAVTGLVASGTVVRSIVVTAADLSTKTYSISIQNQAAPSNNANLSALGISAGTLSPTFTAAQINYTASVANDVTSVTISATAEQGQATITGTGAKNLVEGLNTFNIVVTAQDGITQKTYTLGITRDLAGSNSLSLTVTIQIPGEPTLNWTFGGAFTGTYAANTLAMTRGAAAMTVSVTTLTGTLSNLSWRISGAEILSGNNLSLNPNNYNAGPMQLVLWFTHNGEPYSQSVRITVQN